MLSIVIRNGNRVVMAVLSEKISMPSSLELVEILAGRRAATCVAKLGLNQVIFQGDSFIVYITL